ncbi:MAG: hypothetical protein AMXMBFR84_22110 [Candidatus Hydrogenedentota bacterium]
MPTKKHNFTVVEIKAGVMVLIAGIVFFVFLAAALNWRPAQDQRTYVMYASDTGGLNRGADVRYGGVLSGRVSKIEVGFDPAQPSKIRLTAKIDANVPLNAKSEAFIGQTTLTSPKHLEITTGSDDAPLLAEGDTIAFRGGEGGIFGAIASVGNEIVGAMDTVNDLLEEMKMTVEDVRLVLGVAAPEDRSGEAEDLKSTLATLFESLEATMDSGKRAVDDTRQVIDENRQTIRDLLQRVERTGKSAESVATQIDSLLTQEKENISSIVGNVDQILIDVKSVTEDLDGLVAGIEGVIVQVDTAATTAGGMIKANSPLVDDLLIELRETARNLKEFSRKLKDDPNAAIWGSTPQGRKSK